MMASSIERKQCGCFVSVTWGTDEETVLHHCPTHDPNGLIGKAAVCSRGRPGLVTGRKELPWGLSWVGIGLDDGTAWASREPRVMASGELQALSATKFLHSPSASAASVAGGAEVYEDDEKDDADRPL